MDIKKAYGKPNSEESFMEAIRNGHARFSDAQEYVKRWHNDKSLKMELHEFLGMTWKQYQDFIANHMESI